MKVETSTVSDFSENYTDKNLSFILQNFKKKKISRLTGDFYFKKIFA